MHHTGSPLHDDDQEEVFADVVVAQHNFILQQISNAIDLFDKKFTDLQNTQKSLHNEVTELKNTVNASLKQGTSTSSQNGSAAKSIPSRPDDKQKVLFAGDSLSRKLNMSVVKNVTNMEFKRCEASSIANTNGLVDIVPRELQNDNYSYLILQGGTSEITNLDINNDTLNNLNELKDIVKTSSEKLYNLAEKSIEQNDSLQKIIILKRMFRCDIEMNGQKQMLQKLSEYGNRVLEDTWLSRGCPDNIAIVGQGLECEGTLKTDRFGSLSNGNFDGIHMNGKLGVQHYTGSLINILLDHIDALKINPICKIKLSQPSENIRTPLTGTNRTPLGLRIVAQKQNLSGNYVICMKTM